MTTDNLANALTPLIERSAAWPDAQQRALGEAMQMLVDAKQVELEAMHALNTAIDPANTWRWYEIAHSNMPKPYSMRTRTYTRVCGYSEADAIARLQRKRGTDAKHIFTVHEATT